MYDPIEVLVRQLLSTKGENDNFVLKEKTTTKAIQQQCYTFLTPVGIADSL